MWYPPPHQQQCWNGYIHHLSPQQQHQKQTYSRTSYYCNTDESLNTNQATTTYVVARNDENESLVHYHPTRVDDVYGKKKFFENKFDLHLRLRLIIYMSAIIYFIFQVSLLFYLTNRRREKESRQKCMYICICTGASIKCFDHQYSVHIDK